jgi:hypothetical protein
MKRRKKDYTIRPLFNLWYKRSNQRPEQPPNSPSSNQDTNNSIRKVVEIKASLTKEQKALEKLAAQSINLQASTKSQKNELARINGSINSLITTATHIREEIVTIETQLFKKDTNAKAAREAEAKATCRSTILLKCQRSYGKAFIKAMKNWYEFSGWKSTKDNRKIGPQTEAILLVFYDISCFF